ncbi:MAG: methylenetetrahydrofolate reductase [Deltaproteobacteria bacterium]|nr:methylenetetrahydrofolate reductase [Deltaproteobacteria bacterium]MBW2054031.1 methylenetetrahydrofolate reductase [Deltaproteobacteria bacterium]
MPLEEKIRSGAFVVFGEFEPPKGADFSPLLNKANLVRGRLDAIVIPEMAHAVLKASSLGGCAFLESHGFETVFQVCPRDRNRLALQADLLSAAALGIKNIMAVQGEDIRYGDHYQARAVNDLDLIELIEAIHHLKSGKDLAGIVLSQPAHFCVGSKFDLGAAGGFLEAEMDQLKEKIDLGVQFIVTSPIFDPRQLQQFTRRIEGSRTAIIPTVLLLKSAGMAKYIEQNLPNITIPPELIRSIQKAPNKPRQCVKIAGELIAQLKEMGMNGVMVSTAGWEDRLPQILDEARL